MAQAIPIIVGPQKSRIGITLPEDLFVDLVKAFMYDGGELEPDVYPFWGKPEEPRFCTGLLQKVVKKLTTVGLRPTVVDRRPPLPQVSQAQIDRQVAECEEILREVKGDPDASARYYQPLVAALAVRARHGTCVLGTGAGKTWIILLILRILGVRAVVLVASKPLLYQMREDFAPYFDEKDIGWAGDSDRRDGKYTIATVHTAASSAIDVVQEAELIIADEAHFYAAAMFRQVILEARNARQTIGFTATYFRSVKEQNKILFAIMGPRLYLKTTSELIKEGYLPRLYIDVLKWDAPYSYEGQLSQQVVIEEWLVENEWRNRAICQQVVEHYKEGRRCFVFVNRIKHGENLLEIFREEFGVPRCHVEFIHGKSGKRRREALAELEAGDLYIVIATKIFGVGVNVPAVNLGAYCSAEKSIVALLQHIGRIMRGTEDVYWIDVADPFPDMLKRWAKCRMEIYASEPEFRVREVQISGDSKPRRSTGTPVRGFGQRKKVQAAK